MISDRVNAEFIQSVMSVMSVMSVCKSVSVCASPCKSVFKSKMKENTRK